ncbi:MAG: hypothetical protein JWO91_3863 [Acidobacteriaceae bacterium]|jgi:hypothetical protein|nr:hypothetical protein [Acidobacteriaceae bacterium]
MANVSTARKLGIAARIAVQQVSRTRTWGALRSSTRTTVAHTGKVMNQLWLEITGFTFLALAAFGALILVREYMKYHAGETSSSRVLVATCFTLMFAWFGLTSFWRVKKKGS